MGFEIREGDLVKRVDSSGAVGDALEDLKVNSHPQWGLLARDDERLRAPPAGQAGALLVRRGAAARLLAALTVVERIVALADVPENARGGVTIYKCVQDKLGLVRTG